ncbi:EamA family transporter RarD [Ostreiculturibacter nitratireducens]|uniref:EamA family transporter RarD n=1 Tax=Ostreiculturibacter nitratireducens TaxID=3075226 RepID=UPI0031B56476
MREPVKGLWAMVAASTIWGLSPLYYKLLAAVPPLEVLSHRTLWSALIFSSVLAFQGRLSQLPTVLKGRAFVLTAFAAMMISANWFLFILSIQIGRATEASLGYYIFPLVAVVIGVAAFGERLRPAQGLAVLLAALAVALLTWGLGAAPWIALMIAGTFGLYGLFKKRLAAGPVLSVTAEVLVLVPAAAVWLFGIHSGLWAEGRPGAFFGHDLRASLLLAVSGVLTAGPLILFSYASRRVRLATVGLVQYINPTLQFGCATLVFAEPFTNWHGSAFGIIWAALALYSWSSLSQERAARRLASSVGTSGTAVRNPASDGSAKPSATI